MRGLARAVLDFVFPLYCPACRRPARTPDLCSSCVARIRLPLGPLCPRCGIPYAGRGVDHLCAVCLRRRGHVNRARACALYAARSEPDDPLMSVLHRCKYERDVSLAPVLAAWLARHCPRDRTYDIVVPVPLHRDRLRWRGFNQAVLLARPLARAWGVAHDPFVLARTRRTPPQVGLDERERRRNIAGAFHARRPAAVRGRRVLLVDDVYTTGATLEECARVLRRAGAQRVDALVLTRAVLQ